MANYDINYNDQRFTQVESDKNVALNDLEQTYAGMIDKSDSYYQAQIDASKQWADKQQQLQQEKTDFAIDKIEQQKAQAKKDYTREQSGAYVDWQKQSNEYGANAEQMAAQGMAGSGYSESSQVSMYNTYQNRVMTARDAYLRAVQNYDNSITEARLQNNSLLAEIAYNALQQQLELSLQGFQYKNQLILDKTKQKLEVENMYYNRYQDVLQQINHENALAEQIRQFNENMAMEQAKLAEQQRQFNAQLAEEQRQYNETMAYNKSKSSGGGSSGGGSVSKSGGSSSGGSSGSVSRKPTSNTQTTKKRIENDNPDKVVNTHGDSWVLIPGHGRFSWTEVYAYVQDGTVKETQTSSGLKYTWVGKTAKNVTPDAKGYAAKQYNLMHQLY
jgi:hypothetical protein